MHIRYNSPKGIFCEIGLIVVLTVLAFILFTVIDLAEWLTEWLIRHEAYELDEIVPTLFVLAILLILFSLRRWREEQKQSKQLAEIEKNVHHLAYFDPLTDLPNRALVLDRINQSIALAQRNNEKLALVFLDLDHFKLVNDRLGHLVGDELLRLIAKRITPHVRDSDTFGRLSGDEFAVVLNGVEEQEATHLLIERIHAQFQIPFIIQGHTLHCTTSMGIAIYPTHAQNLSGLLGCADRAMYEAKADGRNSYCFYSQTMAAEEKTPTYPSPSSDAEIL